MGWELPRASSCTRTRVIGLGSSSLNSIHSAPATMLSSKCLPYPLGIPTLWTHTDRLEEHKVLCGKGSEEHKVLSGKGSEEHKVLSGNGMGTATCV